jgi:hypothetical protein
MQYTELLYINNVKKDNTQQIHIEQLIYINNVKKDNTQQIHNYRTANSNSLYLNDNVSLSLSIYGLLYISVCIRVRAFLSNIPNILSYNYTVYIYIYELYT